MDLARPRAWRPDRADLAGRPHRVLSPGARFQADVFLVEGPQGPVVVKDYCGRGRLIAWTIGRWLCAREVRAHRLLAGVPVVPELIGPVDRFAFALAYRPGEMLSRSLRGRLPDGFMAELEAGVDAIHARGVVHLDLRHRSNVLAGEDGRPVVLDFASAVCPGRRSRLARWIVAQLGRFDRRALDKWRARIGPAQPLPASS